MIDSKICLQANLNTLTHYVIVCVCVYIYIYIYTPIANAFNYIEIHFYCCMWVYTHLFISYIYTLL